MKRQIGRSLKLRAVSVGGLSVAALALYKFAGYAAQDHTTGQNYGMALLQAAYWVVREQFGLVEQAIVPFTEEEISVAAIQYCLRSGGKVLKDTVVKRISVRRLSTDNFEHRGLMYCIDVHYAHGSSGPSQVFLKVFPQSFSSRLRARLTGWSLTEAKFYEEKIADQCSMKVAEVYFCGYIPGRQAFCLVQEMLGHCPRGIPNEVLGVPLSNSIAAVRALARMHAKYMNKVCASDMEWCGRVFRSMRFRTLLRTAQLNIDRFLSLLKNLERDGYLPQGIISAEVIGYYKRVVNAYLPHTETNHAPRETGGHHNVTLCHGDFRGVNLLLEGESGVLVCDFQRVHANSPGVDLASFLSSCVHDDPDTTNTREIIAAYHQELTAHGVDPIDYPWHRLLAETSLGFTYEAFQHVLCVEYLLQKVGLDHSTGSGVIHAEMESCMSFFCSRIRRGISLAKRWNTIKMMELSLASSGTFPGVGKYARWLPQELNEDGFHPDSLSF